MRKLKLFLSCVMFFAVGFLAYAQNINVSGTVTDASTGEGIPFASIQVKGTMTGTATDADGNYTISVPKNATLVFSSIGYINQAQNEDWEGDRICHKSEAVYGELSPGRQMFHIQ